MSFTKDHMIEAAMTVALILYTNFLPWRIDRAAYAIILAAYLW